VKTATAALLADYTAMASAASATDYNAAFVRAHTTDLVTYEQEVLALNHDLLTSVGQG
jgi:hypothetical protein